MIRIAAVLVLLMPGGTVERSGFAAHYRPGLFESVAARRGLPRAECFVAVTDNHTIGAWVRVERPKTGRAERCMIADVCNRAAGDCAKLRQRGIVAELSYGAAKRLCGITHYGSAPPRACIVSVQW